MTLNEYRAEQGLTLEQLAEQLGYSKSYLCEIEGSGKAPWKLALAIEKLTSGRVDAATLNDAVAASRQAAA